jgi:hypothetical protein
VSRSASKPARSFVRFPGSGGVEQDGARLTEAERRRLVDFPPGPAPIGTRHWLDLALTWLKFAAAAVLLYGAYLVGWSSAEPAQGSAAPQPPRREVTVTHPSPSDSAPSAVAVVAIPRELSAPPSTPAATITVRRLSSDEFREIQDKLQALGHDPGPVDGFFGPQTIAAVKRYEIAKGREPTGGIDLRLLEQLRREP